jgi:MFS family permease
MDVNLPQSVILKYYLYQASVSFGFFTPIFTLFLLYRGLSYTQIAILSTIYAIITILGEIPTGYIGDRIGRRNSLIAGSIFMTLSIVGFAVAESFLALAGLYVLWAFSLMFRSGSGDAWLYDTLEEEIGGEHFTRIRGRAASVHSVVTIGAIFAGSALYSINPELPFLASGILNGAGIAVLFSLPENKQYTDTEETDETFTIVEALPVIRQYLTRPPLRSFVLYMGIFFGTVLVVSEYIQPIAVLTLGVPISFLGPLYAGFTLLSAILSYYAGDISDCIGVRRIALAVPLFVIVSLLIPVFVPLLAFPMFFIVKGSNTLLHPIATQYVNDHTESVGRATILSAVSMVYATVKLPLYLVSGVVADAFIPIIAVATLGEICFTGITVIYLWEAPVAREGKTVSGSAD